MHRAILVFATVCALAACKQRDSDGTELHFQIASSSYQTAMEKLYDAEKKVCINAWNDANRKVGEAAVQDTVKDWFNLARKIDASIPTKVMFSCPAMGRYFSVSLLDYGGRDYHKGSDIFLFLVNDDKTRINPFEMRRILRHEIGHAFGLGDTYLPGNVDQPNQPPSTMNDRTIGPDEDEYPDTKYGFAALYAQHHATRLRYAPKLTIDKKLFVLAKTGGHIESRCYYAQQKRYLEALHQLNDAELDKFASRAADAKGQLAELWNGGYWGANKIGAAWDGGKLYVTFTDWGKSSSNKNSEHEGAVESISSTKTDIDCAVTKTSDIVKALRATK